MGYDCTLHVIDEKLIRGAFVDRLLGKKGDAAFDRREDAAALWKEVRQGLEGADAHTAAHQVCQLAIAFCAAELPYHYERGFCLSLWPHEEEVEPAKVPLKFIGKPDELFERLVEKYPKLRGHFPEQIENNYCTGLFIPSNNVPALLEWVRKRMKRYSKPDQRLFRGLLLVLEEAAARGLAYWEGTEMPVEMRTIRPAQQSEEAEEFPFPEGYAEYIATFGSTHVFAYGPDEECWTAFVDLSQWPPQMQKTSEFSLGAARSPRGRLLTISTVGDEYCYRARIRTKSWSSKPLVLQLDGAKDQTGLTNGGFVGEQIVAFRGLEEEHKLPAMPLIESKDGKRLVPLAGIPKFHGTSDTDIYPGVLRLNDGMDIIIWNGDGYELRGDAAVQTFPGLGHTGPVSNFEGLAWGDDGFFYVGENGKRQRQLYHVRRGQPRVPHLPTLQNVMYIQRGPSGSVILKQGENKKGTLGVLYFPDEQAFIPIEPELFPDEDPDDVRALLFSEGSKRLIAATSSRLWAVPIEPLLKSPWYNAETGRAIKK